MIASHRNIKLSDNSLRAGLVPVFTLFRMIMRLLDQANRSVADRGRQFGNPDARGNQRHSHTNLYVPHDRPAHRPISHPAWMVTEICDRSRRERLANNFPDFQLGKSK
jgi:hypothetical protein